jgi:nucleoside phosphorylase
VVAYIYTINRGYILYSTAIAGITPCYSPLLSTLNVTPPPGLTLDPTTLPTRTSTIDSAGGSSIPSTTLSTTISAPLITTSISNNVYYSVPFPVQPPSGSNISKGDIVAISLCSFIGISALASWFLWRRFWQKQGSGFKKHGYTVVWIAPLEIEALAAKNMLENIHHDVKFPLGRGDDFIYTAGDINGHNIIIATFPSGHCYGVGAGASLATDVRAKFPDLLFGLLVGVAGGLPELSKAPVRDIRLGDVLVAEGQNGGSSIVRYGFGKETEHKFQVNLVGSKTAAPVASGIGAMKRFSLDQWISFRQYYQSLLAKDANNYTTFRDPGQNKDQYFATSPSANNGNTNSVPLQREPQPNDDSIQVSSQGPDGGNPNPVPVPREERPDDERIKVWYGKIGSGDTLMKNARRRDELKEDYEIIGLEMEAAGVMDVIPVGVIRGVCDYADERKNKAWQSFAAATAAAYAKALLYTIDPDPALNRTVPIGSPRG